jgi:acetoin utilization protein AcuB
MRVKDLMTPRPFTIEPHKPVLEALLVMYEHDIRRLPVVEQGKMVGIISDRDIKQTMDRPALANRRKGGDPELELSVGEVMTRNVVSVMQDDDVKEVVELMIENKITGLPVLNQGKKLVGIVSAIDVLQYCLDVLEQAERPKRK